MRAIHLKCLALMRDRTLAWLVGCGLAAWLALSLTLLPSSAPARSQDRPATGPVDHSPVDLVLTPDEQWLLTAKVTGRGELSVEELRDLIAYLRSL